jgi:tetratricopeptide (TPR) repeat protein
VSAYHKTRQYNEEEELCKKAVQDFPDDPVLLYRQTILALSKGNIKKADEYTEKYKSISKENSVSEADIATNVARIYYEAEIMDKSEENFRLALSLEPENPMGMNNLAYFLIDNDRNINEGLELIDKPLIISPDNYEYLHTKGWGLYKQGKYQQALEILQKGDSLKPVYNHELFLHLEAAKKAVAGQKNN